MPKFPWRAKGNFFSLLTESERALYTGANMSDRGLDIIPWSSRAPQPLANAYDANSLDSVRQLVNKTLDFRVVELPVMHQGAFANSWAFSAVAVIEYLLAIVSNTKQPISTQYFIDCLNKPCSSDSDCEGSRCKSGYCVDKWWHTLWEKAINTGYAPAFSGYKGAVNTANCHSTDAAPNVLKDVIVSGGAMLGRHNREDELLHYIDSYGPLVVCIQVDKKVFYYDGGIFSYCIGGLSCNHAVVLVGYNNEQLTLKNSWGRDWGDNGFFEVKRGCGDDGYSYWASWMHMVNDPGPVDSTEETTEPAPLPLTSIWEKSPVTEKKDYYLTKKLEVDDYLVIKGNAQDSRVLHISFITDKYEFPYILAILRKQSFVYQSFKANAIQGPKIYDDLMAPIPDNANFTITITITSDRIITRVDNEETFTGFYHQAPLDKIKYIECKSDNAYYASLRQWRLGVDENLLGLDATIPDQ